MRARESERETARHTNLLSWLGFLEYRNQCLGQSIGNLVTTASDEDPKPKLIVLIGFCTAKSDIPQYNALCTFYRMHTFLN